MTLFRRLVFASTAATLLLVTIGGLVRATKSGLGCGTDWPRCSGRLVPALESRAVVIEYSHRVMAGLVVVLLATLLVTAWRARVGPRLLAGAAVAFGLVVFQAALGAVVVTLELEALSVVLHLTTAMALLGVLVALAIGALRAEERLVTNADPRSARFASFAAAAVLGLLALGSYVSGSEGAGLAFGDWPLMNGRVVPELSSESAALHFAHRAAAGLVGIVVAVCAWRIIGRRDELPVQARLAHLAAGAYAVQVLIGALNVWSELNALVVTAHLLVGAVIWAALVAIASASGRVVAEPAAQRRLRGRGAALDVGR